MHICGQRFALIVITDESYLMEAVVQRQWVVPQQLLLLEAEQPLAERQAGPRHC